MYNKKKERLSLPILYLYKIDLYNIHIYNKNRKKYKKFAII